TPRLQRPYKRCVVDDVDACALAQALDMHRPAGRLQVDDRIGAEGRAHPLAPALRVQGAVVVEGGRGGVRRAEVLDVEPLEQGPRREVGRGQLRGDVVVYALGAGAGELL